jgi:hypothetical protein
MCRCDKVCHNKGGAHVSKPKYSSHLGCQVLLTLFYKFVAARREEVPDFSIHPAPHDNSHEALKLTANKTIVVDIHYA